MFERFAHEARAAVGHAQDLSTRWHDDHIGADHLLAGAALAGGPATRALARLRIEPDQVVEAARAGHLDVLDPDALAGVGIDLDTVRVATETTFGPGALERAGRIVGRRRGGRPPFDDDAKALLAAALREAIAAGHRQIDTGHLLVAAAGQQGSAAQRVLRTLRIPLDELAGCVAGARDTGRGDDGPAARVAAPA